jgi:hypothetical protein
MTTKVEFIRSFLLDLDVLGVYHPDNQNEDEYDAHIHFTIDCLEEGYSGRRFAISLIGQYFEGDDSRLSIESIATKYDAFVEKYKSKFLPQCELALNFLNKSNLVPIEKDGYAPYVNYIASCIEDKDPEFLFDYINEFFIVDSLNEELILNIFNNCVEQYKDRSENI